MNMYAEAGGARPRAHRRTQRSAAWLVAVAVAAVPAAGCADARQPDVRRVAAAFEASPDAAQRCALIAPATVAALEHDENAPCAQALGEVELPGGDVVSAEVWGDRAQVRLTGDTLFLTRTGAGWRVAAAGCSPNGDAPYLCRLEA